jgi:hypothetical protein
MANVTVSSSKDIRRPIDKVRAQFGDMKHHGEHLVHAKFAIALDTEDERGCEFWQQYRLLGLMRRDRIRMDRESNGSLHFTIVEGPSKGTESFATFESLGPDATRVEFKTVAPLRGLLALAKPLIKRQLMRATVHALEEDRIDLEERGYPR